MTLALPVSHECFNVTWFPPHVIKTPLIFLNLQSQYWWHLNNLNIIATANINFNNSWMQKSLIYETMQEPFAFYPVSQAQSWEKYLWT